MAVADPAAHHGAMTTDSASTARRLFRSTTDAKLAGVASGLARYFNIDPTLVRVGFVVAALCSGAGLVAYALLWALVPTVSS
jgi:phage shock protein C